ncbi:Kunitz/Bovine pancreatic trypsin inhibitor domain protein [Ancylostoma ceylanicum]|uniref:Kunitz/Bovine pancreatic trypsin inhibitor domain protein n=1 Tax=Ancylostoma ceylanicum TaxID=53326 RepID=A0A0D6LSL9_9BILA|nr:Kunitz/Bovine pancreatic trypsin inhibitor domain protein [Ancylostoma ceylanicum]
MRLIVFVFCLVTVVTSIRPPLNETPAHCLEDADNGLCKACMIRYYYDRALRRCEPFVYSGCGGNENNFAKFITSEMTYLGIGFATYLDQPRGIVVSYVNEKDIPPHEELVVSRRRICEFLNYCLIRFDADLLRPSIPADSIQKSKTESDTGDVKPPVSASGTSVLQSIMVKSDLSANEVCPDSAAICASIKTENDTSDVKPSALPSRTSNIPDATGVKSDDSAEDVSVDPDVEDQRATDPALLKKTHLASQMVSRRHPWHPDYCVSGKKEAPPLDRQNPGFVSSLRPPLRQTPDFCLEEAVRGPCRARYLRYYYNEKSEKCEAFTYDTSSIKRQGDVKISLTVDVEETKTISGDVESV